MTGGKWIFVVHKLVSGVGFVGVPVRSVLEELGQVLQANGDAAELVFRAGVVELVDEEFYFDLAWRS